VSSRNPWWALLAAVMVAGTLPAKAATFRQTDYAYSANLRVTGAGPAYAASIPLEVYRSVTRADLTDICVVNASGEVVPFAVRRLEAPPLRSPEPVRLRLFPILGTSEGSGEALRLRLRLREGETAVDIERSKAIAGPDRPSSYLVDARALQRPMAEIRIGWDSAASDFSARLQIDASDDLEHWRPISSGAQVVSLHYAGQAFVRNEVPVDSTHATFLRLTWNSVQGSPVINKVEAIPSAIEAPRKRLSLEVAGSAAARQGEFDFDLGARLPVEQVNLLLPEPNSIVRAQFLVPVSGTRKWRTVAEGQIYDLALPEAGNLANTPIAVPPTPGQHWRVRISEAGGGIGQGVPRLEVSWIPSEVVFLARGKGPFRLLYGNADAQSLALTPGAILNPMGSEDVSHPSLQPGRATLEAAHLLGGPARLTPAAPSREGCRVLRSALWTAASAARCSVSPRGNHLETSVWTRSCQRRNCD
jgi:Protein of unknown function (DUF3999)